MLFPQPGKGPSDPDLHNAPSFGSKYFHVMIEKKTIYIYQNKIFDDNGNKVYIEITKTSFKDKVKEREKQKQSTTSAPYKQQPAATRAEAKKEYPPPGK